MKWTKQSIVTMEDSMAVFQKIKARQSTDTTLGFIPKRIESRTQTDNYILCVYEQLIIITKRSKQLICPYKWQTKCIYIKLDTTQL